MHALAEKKRHSDIREQQQSRFSGSVKPSKSVPLYLRRQQSADGPNEVIEEKSENAGQPVSEARVQPELPPARDESTGNTGDIDEDDVQPKAEITTTLADPNYVVQQRLGLRPKAAQLQAKRDNPDENQTSELDSGESTPRVEKATNNNGDSPARTKGDESSQGEPSVLSETSVDANTELTIDVTNVDLTTDATTEADQTDGAGEDLDKQLAESIQSTPTETDSTPGSATPALESLEDPASTDTATGAGETVANSTEFDEMGTVNSAQEEPRAERNGGNAVQEDGQDIQGGAPDSAEHEPTGETEELPEAQQSMAAIDSAAESALKPHAQAQASLIEISSLATELTIMDLATKRRQGVREHLAKARTRIVGFVEGNIATARAFIISQQAAILSAMASSKAAAENYVSGVLAQATAHTGQIRDTLNGVVNSASRRARSSVQGISRRIRSVINSVPLPDIPGISRARSLLTRVLSSATQAVSSALVRVIGLIQRALSTALRIIASLLKALATAIKAAFTLFFRAIKAIFKAAIQMLNVMIRAIVSALRRILYSVVLPILRRVETRVLQAISNLEEQSLAQVRDNRQQHLAGLVTALGAGDSPPDAGVNMTISFAEWVTGVQQIGINAVTNNLLILASFIEKISGFLTILLTTLETVTSQIIQAVVAQLASIYIAIVVTAMRMMQQIFAFAANIVAKAMGLLSRFVIAVLNIVVSIRQLVQNPVQRLMQFAESVLSNISSVIRGFVSRVLEGDFTLPTLRPTFDPGPGFDNPIPIPIPIPAPPKPAPPKPAPPKPAPSPTDTILIVVFIIVLILILLYLLYLLYKWLTRPRLPKPVPPKRPRGNEYDRQTPYNLTYLSPWVRNNIQASAGEKLIFGVEANDKDRFRRIGGTTWTDIDPGKGPYEIEYVVSGDAEWRSPGSGQKTFIDPTLMSSNVYLFIENSWSGGTITITATIKDKALPALPPDIGTTRDVDRLITWTIIPRSRACPTSLNKTAGPGATWVSARNATYTYQGEPEIIPPGRPSYENQTVLESFGSAQAILFSMADLKTSWKNQHPGLNTPDKVASFLYGISSNSSFVLDNRDEMTDGHRGFGDLRPFVPAALNRASGVGYKKSQIYSCASTGIGTALIERRYSTSRNIEIRKTGP